MVSQGRIKIQIINKIEDKIEEYIGKTGSSKKWISEQMGMSNQNLFQAFKATNPTIETLVKFSIFLNCNITDLFEYDIIDEIKKD